MIELRKAGPDDAMLIARTRQIVWKETYRGIYPDEKIDGYEVLHYAQRDLRHISNSDENYYLFMDGTDCVGYFSFGPYHYGTYKDFTLCINHLYICGAYKGNGLGRRAFDLIRNYCRDRGISKFFCGCNMHNLPAISFYRYMGGVRGDESVLHDDKSDDIIHFEFYLGE